MPIEFLCSRCGKTLRVGEDNAGKQARCPDCQNIMPVPATSGAAGSHLAGGQTADENWRMRTEDGSIYGPVTKTELDSWYQEGRITAGCQLRRDRDPNWLEASQLYPSLASSGRQPAANPFSGDSPNVAAGAANPYTAPHGAGGPATVGPYGRQQPHRGVTILVLGILSFFCPCLILGIAAWYMGNEDLSAMRLGRMDPTGRGMTTAGMVCGIITTILNGLIILANIAASV